MFLCTLQKKEDCIYNEIDGNGHHTSKCNVETLIVNRCKYLKDSSELPNVPHGKVEDLIVHKTKEDYKNSKYHTTVERI